MNEDKFTNIYRLPGSLQIRIAKWQQTFRGTSDLVLHQALTVRNKQYQKHDFFLKVGVFHWSMRAKVPSRIMGNIFKPQCVPWWTEKSPDKRVFLSRMPQEEAEKALALFKKEWITKHNKIARQYNQIKKKEFMNYAWEELETLYPAIPKENFDKQLWNRLVFKEFGPEKKYKNPYFVKKADF